MSKAQFFISLQPESWSEIEIEVWGTDPGPKVLRVRPRNSTNVLFTVPLQDDEAKSLGRALLGLQPK